jgi:hypothetical protein
VCHFVRLNATINLRRMNMSAVEYLPSMQSTRMRYAGIAFIVVADFRRVQ